MRFGETSVAESRLFSRLRLSASEIPPGLTLASKWFIGIRCTVRVHFSPQPQNFHNYDSIRTKFLLYFFSIYFAVYQMDVVVSGLKVAKAATS